jgi:hypothetical protein
LSAPYRQMLSYTAFLFCFNFSIFCLARIVIYWLCTCGAVL